jgi:hypothetical protein
MDYGKAEGIRKKGLAGLITDNLVEGQGIGSSFGSAISDRTKATFTGIQEKFDPLNIAKKLTGGSNLAPALLGRLTGRKESSLEYFAKPKRKVTSRGVNFETGGALNNDSFTETLGLIYEELKLAEEDRKIINQSKKTEEQDREKEEDRRNKAIVEALTARRKPEETPKEKAKKKKKETSKKAEEKKVEQGVEKKDTKTKTETKKQQEETKKETTKKETTTKKKETAQKVEEKKVQPKPKVEKVPEVVKPEVKAPTKVTPKVTPKVEKIPTEKPKLGKISGKYESGTKGVATISGGMGGKDPGGVSYGKYQLATKTGTMAAFLVSTEGKAFSDKFKGLQPGTPEFNDAYRKVVAENPNDFNQAQHDYIERTHYRPVEDFASKSGLDTSNPAVAEALFSQSVQHGLSGNKKIITNAIAITGPNASVDEQIKALYKARSDYISGLNMDAKVKAGVLKRYEDESRDVLKMSQENLDLKSELRKESNRPMTVINNTDINQTSNVTPRRKEKENDRPAILEKSRG